MIPKIPLCLMGGDGSSQSGDAAEREVIGMQWEKEKTGPGWEGGEGEDRACI